MEIEDSGITINNQVAALQTLNVMPNVKMQKFELPFYFNITQLARQAQTNHHNILQVQEVFQQNIKTYQFQILDLSEIDHSQTLESQLKKYDLEQDLDLDEEGLDYFFYDRQAIHKYLKAYDEQSNRFYFTKMEQINIGKGNLITCENGELILLNYTTETFYRLEQQKSEVSKIKNKKTNRFVYVFNYKSKLIKIGKLDIDINYCEQNILYNFKQLKVSQNYIILTIMIMNQAESSLTSKIIIYKRSDDQIERLNQEISIPISFERAILFNDLIIDLEFKYLFYFDYIYMIPSLKQIIYLKNTIYFQFCQEQGVAYYISDGYCNCIDIQSQQIIFKYPILQGYLYGQFYSKYNNEIRKHYLGHLIDLRKGEYINYQIKQLHQEISDNHSQKSYNTDQMSDQHQSSPLIQIESSQISYTSSYSSSSLSQSSSS
ncbi:hypothetical protein pb186bvf_021205 [Paramecium bursaria]